MSSEHPEELRADGDRRGGRIGRRHGRPFDYGELRLLALAMIWDEPRHGYELIKSIEDRMGGAYSPSPGVIYPTLSWLEDMGYASVEAEQGGRKRYRVTAEGDPFLPPTRTVSLRCSSELASPGAAASRAFLHQFCGGWRT